MAIPFLGCAAGETISEKEANFGLNLALDYGAPPGLGGEVGNHAKRVQPT